MVANNGRRILEPHLVACPNPRPFRHTHASNEVGCRVPLAQRQLWNLLRWIKQCDPWEHP